MRARHRSSGSSLRAARSAHYVAGDEERDWGIATFYADENDPLVEVDCIEPWGILRA